MTDKITIQLSGGETLNVDCYPTAAEGLCVHREYRYSPSKRAHRHTSKWTVSHIESGTSVLLPSQMFGTKMEAMAFAEKVAGIDWTNPDTTALDTEDVWEKVQDMAKEVSNQHFAGDINREGMPLNEITTEDDYDGRFGMRTEGAGRNRSYVIFDKDNDEVVDTFSIPGKATARLLELNREAEGEDV